MIRDFFVIEWLLNQAELVEPYNYIILSDGRDVEFLHNPIPFFEATDEAAGTPQLYVQTEAAPSKGNLGWMNNVWKRCFGRKYPDSQHFYNAGIIAGSKDKLKDLLRHMNEMFLTLDPQHNCNMAVLQRVIMERYSNEVVMGYPLHTEYRKNERTPGAFIKHK